MSNEEDLVSLSQPLLQGEKKPKKTPTNIQDSRLFKYSAFICIISLTFGSYFCFDTPAALPDKFKRDLGITTATFTDFYSWYNWPNVILCFFGGLLIDRVFGVRAGTILFSSLVLLGNLIFAIGALSKNITVMNIGRFIFGVGGENLCVAQNTYAVNWFIGKNLNFIFGIMFGICRLGSTLTLILLTPLYDELNKSLDGNKCLGTVLLIATSTCVLPLFGAFMMVFLDSIRVNATVKIDDQSISSSQETKKKINLNNVFKFPPTFWLVLIITGTFYCGIFPFISVGKVFFISKYGFSPLLATSTNSIVYLISIVGFPFYGYIIDAVGRYSKLIIIAISGVMAAHFLLTFTFINPFVGVILMAVSYSLLSTSLWPMIALIVPKHQLGTAYGMMLSFQNISMAVVNILTGLIVEYKGFFVLEIFFLGILSIGLLSAFILFFIDSSRDGVLGISSKRRKLRQEQILNIQEYEVIE